MINTIVLYNKQEKEIDVYYAYSLRRYDQNYIDLNSEKREIINQLVEREVGPI